MLHALMNNEILSLTHTHCQQTRGWVVWILSYTKCSGNVTFRKPLSGKFPWSRTHSAAVMDFVAVESAARVSRCMRTWDLQSLIAASVAVSNTVTGLASFRDTELVHRVKSGISIKWRANCQNNQPINFVTSNHRPHIHRDNNIQAA
jgi:hypothetical protein